MHTTNHSIRPSTVAPLRPRFLDILSEFVLLRFRSVTKKRNYSVAVRPAASFNNERQKSPEMKYYRLIHFLIVYSYRGAWARPCVNLFPSIFKIVPFGWSLVRPLVIFLSFSISFSIYFFSSFFNDSFCFSLKRYSRINLNDIMQHLAPSRIRTPSSPSFSSHTTTVHDKIF